MSKETGNVYTEDKEKDLKELMTVPSNSIKELGLSFRGIAQQLCIFKNNLLSYPLVQQFLEDPYYQSYDNVVNLDRLCNRLANKMVNDIEDVPPGFGKRILFCTNDGSVFLDVSTFIPDSKWLNYTIVSLTKNSNYKFIENPYDTQYNSNVNSCSDSFNYEETDWSNVIINNNTQSSKFITLKCGSNTEPNKDPNELSPQKTTAIDFFEMDNHTTRAEIIQSITNPYGWASRYSSTNFTINYYVATQLTGVDGYNFFIRLSYFKL